MDNVLWHGKVADPQVCALCLIIACKVCQNSIKDLGRSFDLKYAVCLRSIFLQFIRINMLFLSCLTSIRPSML